LALLFSQPEVLYYLHFGQSDSMAATYSELMNMERWQNIS
jgi:hypothetical protein